MENYSGLLPFLWKTFKKPQSKEVEPEMVPLSMYDLLEGQEVSIQNDEYFLNSDGGKSSRFPKSPGMFGKSPSRFAESPRKSHRRRHSTGLGGFTLPKLLSSHSLKTR